MKDDRPEWLKLKEMLRPGDTLYIWKLDRLGRSSKMLIETAQYLKDHDIQLISITDNIDTSTPMGQFFYGMMALLAEVERNITSERTKAGLAAARARGRYGGRPKLDETVLEMAYMMYESRKYPVKQILEKFNISKTALYNYIDVVKKKEAEAAVKGIAK
jgi:DNA invertase Pin-like site-specific DNA recombinase